MDSHNWFWLCDSCERYHPAKGLMIAHPMDLAADHHIVLYLLEHRLWHVTECPIQSGRRTNRPQLTFTGSTEVGKLQMEECAGTVKKWQRAPHRFDDAD